MKFYAYHGALPEEEKLGGHYIVDVELEGDFGYDRTRDELKRTADLAAVYRLTEEIVCERRFNLIETLAEEIADSLLEKFKAAAVTVAVKKPAPPIAGAMDSAEAEVRRVR